MLYSRCSAQPEVRPLVGLREVPTDQVEVVGGFWGGASIFITTSPSCTPSTGLKKLAISLILTKLLREDRLRPGGITPTIRTSIKFSNERNPSGIDRAVGSGQNVADDLAAHVGEALVSCVMSIGQLQMVQSHQVKDGGVQVIDVCPVLNRAQSDFIGRAVD